ncbi:hypothetical protein Pint_06932 [Pistacia integerrima]|uniref:Uncharacterized protein n=1 Tax=Pistacia integerrima TaxID=434235 RepID=A0ACC0XXY4_9ROSI|nr:hypothetical protein Pint_06932 [Pistacia integerrima]
MVQAAAYGLPIIATKNGGPVDIVKVLNNGLLIDPHDQKAIADALLKLVAEKDVKKLIEAITQKASFNGSASVTRSPGRRQMLSVIAADCYESNSNITEKFQTTIKNVMKAAGLSIALGKVGFILVTGSSLWENMEAIKSCPVNIEDFDAIICNSGSELYYPWRDMVADLDCEAHVEYKWPGENVRSMVIRLARIEDGDEDDDIAEYVDACSSRCYSYNINQGPRGDTDYENLLAGLQKTVIVRGTLDCGTEKPLHGEESSKREDSVPQDSPNIALVEGSYEAQDISAALKVLEIK